MYKIIPEDDYERSHHWYEKKKRRELLAILDNLKKFVTALNEGAKLRDMHGKYIHREPMGVLAIGQEGHGKSLAKTRLYLYVSEENQTIHLIVIGDEREQPSDIELSKGAVERIRREQNPVTVTPNILSQAEPENENSENLIQEDYNHDRDQKAVRQCGPDGEGLVGGH